MAIVLEELGMEELVHEDEFSMQLEALTEAIQGVIERAMLKMNPSPYTKQWWLHDLTQCRAEVKRLA